MAPPQLLHVVSPSNTLRSHFGQTLTVFSFLGNQESQVALPCTPSIHPVSAPPLPHVRFVKMLVHHIALLIVKILRVHPWKFVQDVLNRNEHHCPCGLLFPPVQHQLFLLQLLQERSRHLLHFRRFLLRQRDVGLGEQIENHQFFFGQLLRKATLLFRIQLLGEGQRSLATGHITDADDGSRATWNQGDSLLEGNS